MSHWRRPRGELAEALSPLSVPEDDPADTKTAPEEILIWGGFQDLYS